MPNHVTTVLIVTGPKRAIDAFVSNHVAKNDKGKDWFDFGTVIPKPTCVEGTQSGSFADLGFYALTGLEIVKFPGSFGSSVAIQARNLGFEFGRLTTNDQFADWLREHKPEIIAEGEKCLQCFRETGYRDWYEWSVANWGTKWGAYDYEHRERSPTKLVIKFETAWSVPRPVLRKLVELHPSLTLEIESIDEGGPEYVGKYVRGFEVFEEKEHDLERYRRVYGRDPYTDDDSADAEVSP